MVQPELNSRPPARQPDAQPTEPPVAPVPYTGRACSLFSRPKKLKTSFSSILAKSWNSDECDCFQKWVSYLSYTVYEKAAKDKISFGDVSQLL